MPVPKYAKQPTTLRNGAWVRFKSDRYARIRGQVGQVVKAWYYGDGVGMAYDVETADGRTRLATVFAGDVVLLTPDEAQPFIGDRAARLERERARQASLLPDVSGLSFLARMSGGARRRRWS